MTCVCVCVRVRVRVRVRVCVQRREAEYDVHLRDKMVDAKNNFRLLLKETKLITYK